MTDSQRETMIAEFWYRFKRRGCPESREQLIHVYGYLVPKTRKRVVPKVPIRIAVEDLHQEGAIGLTKAVDQFEPRREVKFESYAISMIRGSMLEYLRHEDWVPRRIRTKQQEINGAWETLVLQGNSKPSDEDLAAMLEISVDDLGELRREIAIPPVFSLDDTVYDDGHDDSDSLRTEVTLSDQRLGPDVAAIVDDEATKLSQFVQWLPSIERDVIELYYYGGWTLKQIAGRIARSESRAYQLHRQAIRRLTGYVAHYHEIYAPPGAETSYPG